jgi:ketosteroid isomerase-like protein
MKSKLVLATAVTLVGIGITWMLVGSRAFASADSVKAEIIALNEQQLAAFNKKDLDGVMAFYVDDKDAVFYEDAIPFQLDGPNALRKLDQEFFGSASQVHAGMEAISVVVSGDLGAAHYTLPLTFTDKDGTHSIRGRFTQVLKRVGGRWLIWHEHLSVPYDPATGKAVLDAKP